ncbi:MULTISPECIES: UDP-glucose 4-epimerase GalE [unclassified Corynebacterium]|uniref:UDP-glucose 4-epimerase GalE n=1 Tax=unclassified Corynebacterium TaxID=2624378 RepID=UPI0021A9D286|nr:MULTISPECIES: UDP-glucose 4-epimerase GalE [unclassified Corynebacterium]MCT1452269.1 UDP-glucose 4-epimerase GalE [Corynebacterium sp. p3-SID1145]MCT1461335.1 UDP-glucose 4-epimerase GalE [Corynebacterium sp. p3-SID1140]MDN8593801.1 UDP-glucose 4-epimerase GalE [Corynebacterium sp. P4_F2]WKK55912.1 UDP-glucose 4-epimerase GalE [Corynebacterium sp. P4-C1]WKK63321.1 UDP-glucose 4-epimerase GalE [Corynebacterium sp. P8-C1]
MSRLVVTGGAGYVGSVCSKVLLEAGHAVTIVDNFSTGNRDAVPEGADLVAGDINDVIDDVLAGGGVDGVLHFAARSLVGESVEKPDEYWRDNVGTTLKLLNSMRDHNVNSLVFSSTAATYGEPERVPITEDMPTAPTNAYGATKLAIDYAITSYATAFGLGATSLRYFNVAGAYGGLGENHATETHLIPLVLQVAQGKRDKILMYGNDWPTADGTCVRDYIHIRDLADAHLLALESNAPGKHRIFNLGSGDGYSVKEVIEACRRVTGHPIPAEVAPRRAGDPATLIASSQRAKDELGWTPTRTDLDQIVADAWEYTQSR